MAGSTTPASSFLEIPQEDQPFPDYETISSEGAAFEMRRIVTELASRRMESLKLYQPMPLQAGFHASMAKERILRGGNRSGKTLSAAVEVARAVTGQDPWKRYPEKGGICYCVGFDGRHVGQTMWKKLARAGAFKIIRDLRTKKWRAFFPNDPEDARRAHLAKAAPPLIPNRMIESISWFLKKENQPQVVKLVNGWELHFFSGNAKPPQGSTCHLGWFDEEIADGEWYNEIAARLVDENGWFIWSATPQAGTDQLYNLHERAEEQVVKDTKPRTVEEFVVHINENVHMTDEQRTAFIDKLDEDSRDIRVAGEFAGIHRVFPEYNPKYHEVEFRDIPDTWTRYIGIDPGRQVCAALFLAVPPPTDTDNKDQFYLYDELYIKDCDAVQFGRSMKEKCDGQHFRAFIIDPNEAPKHDTGGGLTIEEQYRKQLQIHSVKSELTGSGFLMGDDNRRGAFEAIRLMLKKQPTNSSWTIPSALRVIAERCPNFIWEIKHLKYKKIANIVTDDPDERKRTHLIACLRYLIQYRPKWYPLPKREPGGGMAYKRFLRKQEKASEAGGGYGIMLGPGGSHAT